MIGTIVVMVRLCADAYQVMVKMSMIHRDVAYARRGKKNIENDQQELICINCGAGQYTTHPRSTELSNLPV